MHPKQVPSIIMASMLLTLVIMATISAAFTGWYLVVIGGTFVIALIGVILGRYVPKPYDNSITDIVIGVRTLASKIDVLCDGIDASPLALQKLYTDIVKSSRRMEKALAMLLARTNHDQLSERSDEVQ